MGSVLLMSKQGDGIPLVIRMAQEGNICKVFLQDSSAKNSLKGYKNPSVIGTPRMLEQYDMILFDMAGMGSRADEYSKQGLFTIGGGKLNDSLELDRAYGEKVVNKLTKLKVPDGPMVKDSGTGIKILEAAGKPYVIKPLNNRMPNLTLVSESSDNSMLISVLQNHSKQVLPCMFQERIDGIEISTEGWFNGKEFISFNHTIEYKRLMEGNNGPMTGCMGNIVWSSKVDKIIEQGLLPLTPLLQKGSFIGPIDINCICTEQDCYFLEFTPRFGYDAIQALMELMYDGLFKFLWTLASGTGHPRLRDEYAIGVRVGFPPFPNHDADQLEMIQGLSVLNLSPGAMKHVCLSDVALDNGREVIAGVDGVLGCVTARGKSIQEVRRRAYRTLKNISNSSDIIYRKDIGSGVEYKIGKLKEWGWLDA